MMKRASVAIFRGRDMHVISLYSATCKRVHGYVGFSGIWVRSILMPGQLHVRSDADKSRPHSI